MKSKRPLKITADIIVLLCSGYLLLCIYRGNMNKGWLCFSLFLLILFIIAAADLMTQARNKENLIENSVPANDMAIRQLILLDDQDHPIKSWELSGRIAVMIGKKNKEEEVDVDLEDCEFGTFINSQHAALNFCHNSWYIEDLGSQNGVKVKKVEDGACYKVLNRPCRVMPGDIIFIANTKLLLT